VKEASIAISHARPVAKRARRKWNHLGYLSFAVLLAVWWLVSANKLVNPIFLPGPVAVFESGVELTRDGTLLHDILISLFRVYSGFLLAALLGVVLGILLARSRLAYGLIGPVIEAVRPIPPIAWFPLIIIWLGIGEAARISVIVYGAFFPILLNTIQGVRSVENNLIRAALSLGASRRQIFYLVVLPAVFPSIVTGLRVGAGMAMFVLVAAELIASSSGIGYLILDSREHLFTDRVILGMIVLGILGVLQNKLLMIMDSRLIKGRPPQE
jgi:ABC-type nitrate/sulfonate/bicarbonate transport system permease component